MFEERRKDLAGSGPPNGVPEFILTATMAQIRKNYQIVVAILDTHTFIPEEQLKSSQIHAQPPTTTYMSWLSSIGAVGPLQLVHFLRGGVEYC